MRSAVDKNSREYLENKMKSARHSLLLVLIFTVVNLVLLLADGNTYFLFSASVPYYLTAFGMGMDADAGHRCGLHHTDVKVGKGHLQEVLGYVS